MPEIYDDSAKFVEGELKLLKSGTDAILSYDCRVKAALSALRQGISASVYDMYSLKPDQY